jgi:hypothetical protein
MQLPPLTHHEIIEVVAPFSRGGRRVDLAATNRVERRLVFRPTEHRPAGPAPAASRAPGSWPGPLHEQLELENLYAGSFKLTRRLTPAAGPPALLVAEGADPGALLVHIESVPSESQFRAGDGWRIALSHTLAAPREPAPAGGRHGVLVLQRGTAEVAGFTLHMKMPAAIGFPASLKLVAAAGDTVSLPEDLLSVIGWDWAPLRRDGREWMSKLRLRGKGDAYSRRAEAKLEKTVEHIAETLRAPPTRYHERFLAARWGVVLRRTIPLWMSVLVMLGVFLLPQSFKDEYPNLTLCFLGWPIILIAFTMTLQEEARLEIPPLPRPLRARDWRPPAQDRNGHP